LPDCDVNAERSSQNNVSRVACPKN
jgi:hypothetical protein